MTDFPRNRLFYEMMKSEQGVLLFQPIQSLLMVGSPLKNDAGRKIEAHAYQENTDQKDGEFFMWMAPSGSFIFEQLVVKAGVDLPLAVRDGDVSLSRHRLDLGRSGGNGAVFYGQILRAVHTFGKGKMGVDFVGQQPFVGALSRLPVCQLD
jgi:hypothetical protein